MARRLTGAEISRHNTTSDVWLVVNGKVYDMTEFAPEHPGGSESQDASEAYNEIHAPSLIQKTLEEKFHVGALDTSTDARGWHAKTAKSAIGPKIPSKDEKPPLDEIINLYDFEEVAKRTLSPKGWAYINGASNDNITRDANNAILKRIWFRPFVLKNVATVSTKTRLFGCDLSLPVYISPTGQVRTAGPEGELAEAKGAAASGIIHCISTPASFPHEEILDVTPKQAFFQLYVNKDRRMSEKALRQVTSTGKVKAMFITVDLPVVSKREADERVKPDVPIVSTNVGLTSRGKDRKGAGLARQTGAFIDPSFDWEGISWVRSITDLPIVVKGIQRFEDARKALQMGCQGIVLSNHGGRAADNAAPAIVTLLELHKNCPGVFGKMEILIDGGFRRGSDIVKAICLGASAVGIGRPFMYAVNYGQEGVEHLVDILQDEIETAMRLCGMTDLMRDASPEYVNTLDIEHLVADAHHPYLKRISRL